MFFFDCAAAYDETGGSRLENLVACCLLKHVQWKKDSTGANYELYYLRDKEKREVDFVIVHNRKVEKLIEVKKSSDGVSSGLRYYTEKLKPKESIQLVLELARPQEKNGVKILPLASWLESL